MVQPVVTFHRSISSGSYGGLKSEVVQDFSRKVAFFENFQEFVLKGFIATQIHVLRANFVKFG